MGNETKKQFKVNIHPAFIGQLSILIVYLQNISMLFKLPQELEILLQI
jgi:hypothetical protein